MWWPAVVKFPLRLDYGQSPHAYVNQRLQIQLELLMMSGVPLEICWAFNERWNNKFCYKVASCWLFLLNHTMMHGSMNIKLFKWLTGTLLFRTVVTVHDITLIIPLHISALDSEMFGAPGSAVGWGTALQVMSRVQLLEFFIDIILPATLWPWSWLSL